MSCLSTLLNGFGTMLSSGKCQEMYTSFHLTSAIEYLSEGELDIDDGVLHRINMSVLGHLACP
jgi:hypothetical protein